jgi:hypothetical protein
MLVIIDAIDDKIQMSIAIVNRAFQIPNILGKNPENRK